MDLCNTTDGENNYNPQNFGDIFILWEYAN